MKGFILALLPFAFLVVIAEARNARFMEGSKVPAISKDISPPPATLEEAYNKHLNKQGNKHTNLNLQKTQNQSKNTPNIPPKNKSHKPLISPGDKTFYDDLLYDYYKGFSNEGKRDDIEYNDFDIREEDIREESLADEYKHDDDINIKSDELDDKSQASFNEDFRNNYYSDPSPRDEELFPEDVSQDELREELLRAVLQVDELPYNGRNLNNRRNMRVDDFLKQNLQLSELTKQDALLRKVLRDNGMGKSDKMLLKLREKLLKEELLRMEAKEQGLKHKKVLKI